MKFKSLYIFIILVIFIYSCSGNKSQVKYESDPIFYPKAPNEPRIQFLMSINSSADIDKSKHSAFKKFVTGEEPKITAIFNPNGIFVRKDLIYISDVGNNSIDIVDLKEGKIENFSPKGEGQIIMPLNCFVDKDNFLFIADGYRKQVLVFDKENKFIAAFGEKNNFKPTDVSILGNKIFVSDVFGHKIYVYENKLPYKLLYSFPDSEPGDDSFLRQPKYIWIRDKKIYVSDFGDFNVKIFDLDGTYEKKAGSQGVNFGQFARPKGIAVDKESRLFVVDAAFENIQIFNKDLQLLMFFGEHEENGTGNMYLPSNVYIDYENLEHFETFVDEKYQLKYLIFVTNQHGANKLSVYGAIEPKK